jgi:hypothetical protein
VPSVLPGIASATLRGDANAEIFSHRNVVSYNDGYMLVITYYLSHYSGIYRV